MLLSVNETRPRLHSTLTPLDLIGTDHFATTPPGRPQRPKELRSPHGRNPHRHRRPRRDRPRHWKTSPFRVGRRRVGMNPS